MFSWFLHSLIEGYKKTAQRGGFNIFLSMALCPEKKPMFKIFLRAKGVKNKKTLDTQPFCLSIMLSLFTSKHLHIPIQSSNFTPKRWKREKEADRTTNGNTT